jgi:hypothetical protein
MWKKLTNEFIRGLISETKSRPIRYIGSMEKENKSKKRTVFSVHCEPIDKNHQSKKRKIDEFQFNSSFTDSLQNSSDSYHKSILVTEPVHSEMVLEIKQNQSALQEKVQILNTSFQELQLATYQIFTRDQEADKDLLQLFKSLWEETKKLQQSSKCERESVNELMQLLELQQQTSILQQESIEELRQSLKQEQELVQELQQSSNQEKESTNELLQSLKREQKLNEELKLRQHTTNVQQVLIEELQQSSKLQQQEIDKLHSESAQSLLQSIVPSEYFKENTEIVAKLESTVKIQQQEFEKLIVSSKELLARDNILAKNMTNMPCSFGLHCIDSTCIYFHPNRRRHCANIFACENPKCQFLHLYRVSK